MKRVFIAALACVSMHAYANTDLLSGDWILADQTHNGANGAYVTDYLFEKNTAVRTGNRVAFWDKVVAYSPDIKTLTSYGHHVGDCSTQVQTEDASTIDGLNISRTAPNWQTFAPNNPEMKLLLAVCKSVQ